MADLDRMLDVLHGDADRRPLPGIGELEALCTSVADTGLAVELRVTGDTDRVNPSLGVTVYRIVQEALTNVIKHARARHVSVVVEVADEVFVTVTDDGVGSDRPPGRGLRGIEERVTVHGGVASHGNRPGGGFVISGRLPLGAGS